VRNNDRKRLVFQFSAHVVRNFPIVFYEQNAHPVPKVIASDLVGRVKP
jgi:hypothetical protein